MNPELHRSGMFTFLLKMPSVFRKKMGKGIDGEQGNGVNRGGDQVTLNFESFIILPKKK